jgi:hypothetical protein
MAARRVDAGSGLQYWRAMIRTLVALAVVAMLAGCDGKKEAATTTTAAPAAAAPATTTAPTPTPSTVAMPPAASGEAAKPSGEAAKPSTKPGGALRKTAAPKPVPPTGGMPHGNPEDGTLKYNPPPAQNPNTKK